MTPSWRKPTGMLGILLLIVIWAALVTSLSATVGGWPWPAELAFYLITGIVWIAPLKPLLRWMETGKWRE
jgi:membrane protein implicated in regulation of membrane protease activity